MQETLSVGGGEQLELSFPEDAPAPRCGSCGVPIAAGDLCDACEQAFRSVLVGAPRPADAAAQDADANPYIAAGPEFAPVEPSVSQYVPSDVAASVQVDVAPPEPVTPVAAVAAPEPAVVLPAADAVFKEPASKDSRAALVVVGAVVIAAVVGLPAGARWLANQRQSQIVAMQNSVQPTPPAPAAHRAKPAQAAAA